MFGRNAKAFGHALSLDSRTVFPSYRRLRLPSGNYLSQIVKHGDYVQIHSIVNYFSRIEHPAIFVDIGAHHGAYAIVVGKMLRESGGKVIAVEPNPDSFQVLRRNVELNGLDDTVYCIHKAASDKNGKAFITTDDVQSRLTGHGEANYSVETVTLRSLLEAHGIDHVDALQVDVEGAELPVLRGFPWENITVDRIYCEFHPYAWNEFGYDGRELKRFMRGLNLRCFDMYLNEHCDFKDTGYIGPTLLFPGDMEGDIDDGTADLRGANAAKST